MSEENIKSIIDVTTEKLRALVDADTVLGTPVKVENHTIVPVSRVSFGLATGGSDFPSKSDRELFGGGGGAGVSMVPIGFIAVTGDNVRFIPMSSETSALDRALSAAPDILSRIKNITSKQGNNQENL